MHTTLRMTILFSAAFLCMTYSIMGAEAGGTPPAAQHDFSTGNNAFALDLYKQLRTAEGNLFLSPYSIRTALAMTYAGARGETASQMKKALSFSFDDTVLQAAFAESIKTLNTSGGDNYEMTVANSLWTEKTHSFLHPFIETNKNIYGGCLERVDFKNNSEGARLRINGWVEDATRKKITNLIPRGGVHKDTRLVLVNAVYFKGLWSEQFDKKHTRTEPFYCKEGRTLQAPLMKVAAARNLPFYREEGLRMVELAYKGEDISMLVLLPDAPDGLAALEKKLDVAVLKRWIAGLRIRSVQVFLPRFTMTWGAANIVPQLRSLGMQDAFDNTRADFSAIDGTRTLLINGVFHKAFVDVNEEGTEAAAATGVVVGITSMPPPPEVFRADHPFLFLLREKKTGSILFMGRLLEPEVK